MEAYAAEHRVPIINEGGRKALIEIIKKTQPHRVLEIGTAIGYSALLFMQNAAADVSVTTLELSEERAQLAKSFWQRSPYANRIELLLGDAAENLQKLAADKSRLGQYDFVFIDAAKGQYPDYFHKIKPLLTADATIAADNVLFRGYVRSQEKPPRRYKTIVKRLREYLELVNTPPYTTQVLENGDGLAVTRKIKD